MNTYTHNTVILTTNLQDAIDFITSQHNLSFECDTQMAVSIYNVIEKWTIADCTPYVTVGDSDLVHHILSNTFATTTPDIKISITAHHTFYTNAFNYVDDNQTINYILRAIDIYGTLYQKTIRSKNLFEYLSNLDDQTLEKFLLIAKDIMAKLIPTNPSTNNRTTYMVESLLPPISGKLESIIAEQFVYISLKKTKDTLTRMITNIKHLYFAHPSKLVVSFIDSHNTTYNMFMLDLTKENNAQDIEYIVFQCYPNNPHVISVNYYIH